jgi:outer membrane immunogenic protein
MEFIMSQIIVAGRSVAPALHPRSRLTRMPAALGAALVCTLPLTAASAADLPTKAAAPAPSAYNWGGCYIGVNAGGGGSGTNFTSSVGAGSHLLGSDPALVGGDGTGAANDTSFLGGGQAGCNWQSGMIVYGLEGDLDDFRSNPQFANGTDTLSDGVTPFTAAQSLRTDFLATVRPRIGIAADRNLAYVTGGVAFSHAGYTQTYADGAAPAGAGTATGSKSLVGWTVGAGWEHAWTDHWTFKLEYLFASFPTTSASGAITDAAGGANPLHGSADLVVQSLRAGVNYKF